MEYTAIKLWVIGAFGAIGALIANLLGGWDTALQTLIVFMTIDYVTGLMVAGIFKKSGKSQTGALNSNIGWMGLSKKCMVLLYVLIGFQLDKVFGTEFVRYGVIFAFIPIEVLSIVENAGLMGVPVPPVIEKAIDILRKKEDFDPNKEG